MSRINTPGTIADSPQKSQPILENVNRMIGSVPNIFRLIGNNPAVLEGYVSLSGALTKGQLDPATRERIAIAIANVNGCSYCNSAHTYLGSKVAKLSDDEIKQNRGGGSSDAKADVAVRFAVETVRRRGKVSESQLREVLEAGYSEAEALEIVGHVALNTLTNYVNEVFQTEIDFPAAELATCQACTT